MICLKYIWYVVFFTHLCVIEDKLYHKMKMCRTKWTKWRKEVRGARSKHFRQTKHIKKMADCDPIFFAIFFHFTNENQGIMFMQRCTALYSVYIGGFDVIHWFVLHSISFVALFFWELFSLHYNSRAQVRIPIFRYFYVLDYDVTTMLAYVNHISTYVQYVGYFSYVKPRD